MDVSSLLAGRKTRQLIYIICCEDAGFSKVQTFIASGNVVFESKASASKVKRDLQARLLAYAESPIGVVVRTAAEMAAVLKANPFPKAAANHTVAIFLDTSHAPTPWLVQARKDEQMRLGKREIFVLCVPKSSSVLFSRPNP
jgi:uncharacterized protein (DUF1697 family)